MKKAISSQKKVTEDFLNSPAPFIKFYISKNEKSFEGKIGKIVRFNEVHLAI